MTTPGAVEPDGAYVIGDPEYGQDVTEESMKQSVEAQARADLETAAEKYGNAKGRLGATRANWYDGQNAFKDRLDLLEDIQGYGSSFMQYNWDVPENVWVVVPYEGQIGPAKRVSINPEGELVLKAGGLWRADSLACVQGYSISLEMYYINGYPVFYNYYNPIVASNMLEVIAPDETIFTAKYYTNTTGVPVNSMTPQGIDSPVTYSFNNTFVIPEVDENDPATWYRVRLSMKWNGVYRPAAVQDSYCRVLGGTAKSGLTVTRWSRDTDHMNYVHEAPDGGVVPA